MGLLKNEFLKIFSLLAVMLFVAILIMALFRRFDPSSKEIAMLILGGVTTQLTAIIGYWFGSSKGSADKTAIISSSAAPQKAGDE